MPAPRWLTALTRALPRGRVRIDAATLESHAGDAWDARALPEAVVLARSVKEVQAVLRIASRFNIPVTTRGAGRGYVGGCVPVRGGIALSVARMNRILEISPGDSVAVVEPGVITGDLQKAVEALGLFYPPDPASLKESSIGGNIATNAGGPRCLKYGVTRGYVLGLDVVLADGTLVRIGSRTHKNKSGFDLTGLFVGSEGMLGVVVGATLRLIPKPPARAALVATFKNATGAASAVGAIQQAGFLPCAMEVADALTLRAARNHTAHVPPGDAFLLVELDGQPGSVRREIAALARIIKTRKPLEILTATTPAARERLWDMRRAFSYSLKATGLKKLNEDIAVPRGRLVDIFALGPVLEEKFGVQVASFGHAGDGNIHVNIMVDPAQADAPKTRAALDLLFTKVLAWGGVLTGEHGIGLAKKKWWPQAASPELHALHVAVKRALDPSGLLNPGKFLDP
jgi:glycolate oxidase